MNVPSLALHWMSFLLLILLASSQARAQAVFLELWDANADGTIDPSDAVYRFAHLFACGPEPLLHTGDRKFQPAVNRKIASRHSPVEAVDLDSNDVSKDPVHQDVEGRPASPSGQASGIIPPLPAGVSELKFSEFFVRPVGDRGLELKDKLLKLDGKRVRILGYMVRRDSSPPGLFLLTPSPAQIHEHDNGLADDLPASMVHVSVPTLRDQPVPYAPALMLLTGTLSVGNQTEGDGRISVVRLALDPPEPANQEPILKPRMGADWKGAPDSSRK